MKKVFALMLALVMVFALVPAAFAADYSGYTIRIYSNSNSAERVNWLVEEAKKTCPDPVVLIEQRLDYSKYVEEGVGTGDCIIIADGTLHINKYQGECSLLRSIRI